MKAKLIVNDREIEIDISEEELNKLEERKETGYERVERGDTHFYDSHGILGLDKDEYNSVDDRYYEIADYYSSKMVAENNIRADKLMRQLRRFAVEHRENKIDWNDNNQMKFCIFYSYSTQTMLIKYSHYCKTYGAVYFDSKEAAQLAVDTFHDELIWYFTEYKDSV